MICHVFAHKGNDGWLLRLESNPAPAKPFVDRTIGFVVDNPQSPGPRFPVPPKAEAVLWNGKPHAVLCDATKYEAIDSVYRRLLENNPKSGDVALFGDYLTAVLLGPNLDILEAFATPVDLRLVFDDASLQRLPWEMMYGPQAIQSLPNTPLSARPNRSFAINREVPLAPGENARAIPQSEPRMRVLFVAESKIDNVLRPGAEFLGLLRHLRVPPNPQLLGDFVNAQVKLRFLPEADIDQLKAECRNFQPSVLHFICHGQSDPAGGPSRIILRKRPPGAAEGETKAHAVTADELVGELTEHGGWLPPVIVLNACYTASLPEQPARIEDGHLPFAARMVQLGAAIAVGMAGEVADPACQMFTLRLYQALLTRVSVVEAASQARRTVLTAWPAYQQSIEWSRPVLFIASGLDGTIDFGNAPGFDMTTAAERFRRDSTRPRMMCDRYDMMVAYDRLVGLTGNLGSDKLIVAFAVEDSGKGIGKTRLLEEFAVRSVVDGFVPCLIRAEGEMPQNLLGFALALTEAINQTRKNFGLQTIPETESQLIAFASLQPPPPQQERKRTMLRLRSMAKELNTLSYELVLDAIRQDCASLAADLAAVTGLTHQPLILIDEFHRWVGTYDEVLRNIDYTGLGTPDKPIPVVLNYVASTVEGQSIQQKLKFLRSEQRPVLRRFDSEVEIEMVYRQFLLSEWRLAPRQTPEACAKVKAFFRALHGKTRGVPMAFVDFTVEAFIEGIVFQNDSLVDADYETALRNFGT